MRFANPWLLTLLLLLPILAWLRGRRGGRAAFLYSSVALVKGISGVTQSHVGQWLSRLRWLALALLVIAMARPQLPEGEDTVRATGIDIVVAIDLSGSMASEDFELHGHPVNRLVIAKDVLETFIKKRPNDRLGLVAFAGRAYVVAPPTLDHDFLLQNVDRLELNVIEDGTAIGMGLTAALNRLKDLPSRSKVVILMTDGQNNTGKVPPMTAAEAAETLKVKVHTIGIGTRGQARFPYRDPFGEIRYRMLPVDIDEDTLKAIAAKTGGSYFRGENTAGLRAIYDQIDRMEKTEAQVKKFSRYREMYPAAALPGLSLLLLELILAHTIWRRLP